MSFQTLTELHFFSGFFIDHYFCIQKCFTQAVVTSAFPVAFNYDYDLFERTSVGWYKELK